MAGRLAHHDALDAALSSWTVGFEPYSLMFQLQAAGVPAGVCQTAGDRCAKKGAGSPRPLERRVGLVVRGDQVGHVRAGARRPRRTRRDRTGFRFSWKFRS